MRTYGQYCPIARASEVLAERWTPIILRDLLLGATTFSEIAAGAPGSRGRCSTTRLRELERAGVVQTTPEPERPRLPLPPHRGRQGPGGRDEGAGDLG